MFRLLVHDSVGGPRRLASMRPGAQERGIVVDHFLEIEVRRVF